MMKRFMSRWLGGLWASGMVCALHAEAPIKFDEVFSLVRSNLTSFSEGNLNKAATLGLVEKLQGKIELTEPTFSESAMGPLVGKTNVFDGSFGYVRINRVRSGVGQIIDETIRSAKKLKGVVLDLRFSKGDDYGAVVEVVNLFLATEQPILKWGEKSGKTSTRADALQIPLAVLVNRQTSGAAEALAGALREQQLALLIGGRTAGQALVFDDFVLSNGQHLKIARTKVELASGQVIGPEGLAPDIAVEVDERNERRWQEDPFVSLAKVSTPSGPAPFLTSVTNRFNHRPNGAEVARRHREELDDERPSETPRPAEPVAPVVQDAALARALDFLKGLAVPRLRDASVK